MASWDALSDKLETDIDLQFGETVSVYPYKKGGYLGETIPDNARQVRNTKGYRISKYTTVRTAGSSAFITKRTEADLLMEIREEYVPDVKDGDRVLMRGVWYDVSFVEYWGNGRNVLHLIHRHAA